VESGGKELGNLGKFGGGVSKVNKGRKVKGSGGDCLVIQELRKLQEEHHNHNLAH